MSLPEEQARAIALLAADRGWLTPDELWEAACRWNNGESTARMLERRLEPEQLAELQGSVDDRTPLYLDSSLMVAPPSSVSEARFAATVASDSTELRPTGDPGRQPGQLTGDRYRVRSVLGRGGVGQVVSARDREIGRRVALKTLQHAADASPRLVRKFLIEARVTAQLEHPNIVPVYDMGVAADGTPFYTMRVVNQQSLAAVLRHSRLRGEWSLARLLGAFVQVSRALGYAHSRGVLHGDIKPENILLGDFGEVYLADWGLTKVAPHSPVRTTRHESSAPPPESMDSPMFAADKSSLLSQVPFDTAGEKPSRPGGTPGYVAPEVADGDWAKIDHRADLFALGVVLFEILTGERPFKGSDANELILNTVTEEPAAPRTLNKSCPLLLDDLCLELLAKQRSDRPASADIVAERVEAYMEGEKESERRREEAARLCSQAGEPVERWRALNEEQRALTARARELLRDVEDWEPIDTKRRGWELTERAQIADREGARALAQAIEIYTKALGYDASSSAAHRGLAELYWGRALEAEGERREVSRVYFETLTLEHDIDGHFEALMNAKARVSIQSDPPGAEVVAQRYESVNRTLVPGPPATLGTTPLVAELDKGSYLLSIRRDGYRASRYPMALERGCERTATVKLYSDDAIGDGFVYVPGGDAWLGGDANAFDPLDRVQAHVDDFAIGKFPVTMRDYCAFIDTLPREEALRRAPHDRRGSEGLAVTHGEQGWEPSEFIIEGAARALFPIEEGHLWRVPVNLIDWFDARAYCQYRSELDNCTYRLPTEHEWEKASRGVDGRLFPWGDHFDATFCKMRDSRKFAHQPEPTGTFATDTSPYGVRDTAGGMREWIGDMAAELSLADAWAAAEPTQETTRGASAMRVIRGGSWSTPRDWCRSCSRGRTFGLTRGTGVSFRLVKMLE